jgi:hypothetical protein
MEALLPLDQPRSIVIKHAEKKFVYRFRRITDDDWKKYYRGILSQAESVNGEQVRTFDFRAALQQLVETTLDRVEGYTGKGGKTVEELADWKLKLPIGHKIAAGLVLGDVALAEEETDKDVSILADVNEVILSAAWSADESNIMYRISGLVHRLNHPTIEQVRRFYRERSRTRVIGGSRTGKTIFPGSQELLGQLYDELIISVDGYSWAGSPLGSPEVIRRYMDLPHKMVAAQSLFSEGEEAEIQDGKGEAEPAA